MARLLANLTIYLCLLFSFIKANENDGNDVQDTTATKVVYKTPEVSRFVYLVETFDDEEKFKGLGFSRRQRKTLSTRT